MIQPTRRQFIASAAAATVSVPALRGALAANESFQLNYILSSAMYGKAPLSEIVPEAPKTRASVIDIWPNPHGNQREQVDRMGVDKFGELLAEHDVQLGGVACYRYGAYGLQPQMKLAKQLGAKNVALVCGGRGPKDATGDALKKAVRAFVEKLKPHHDAAVEHACDICIENHKNNMIFSPDSLKYFAEFSADMPRLGIAFAPHHLPQDGAMQGKLIEQLGPAVNFFYAQELGNGSHHKQPRETELLQMPHRGPLDFQPLIRALKKVGFAGYTEIFMHPYPRGVPILDSNAAITAEINDSRKYLQDCIRKA